eukprot:4939239-Amphidinium_carterae.1
MGEVHFLADGFVRATVPEHWKVECKKRLEDLEGWRPMGQLSFGSDAECTVDLVCSRPLLQPEQLQWEVSEEAKKGGLPEGAGLDLNVEALVR